MKIVVVTGSPHKSGTTALLADKFIEGAKVQVMKFSGLMRRLKIYIRVSAAIDAAWTVTAYRMMRFCRL